MTKLINAKTDEEIKVGDVVTDFRGDKHKLVAWTRPKHPGSTGRVTLSDNRVVYPSVIGAKIVD
jgi:hypothetical protein